MQNDPKAWLEYRKGIEFEVSSRYKFVRRFECSSLCRYSTLSQAMKDSPEQADLFKVSKDLMETKLASKPELAAKLIPTFAVGGSLSIHPLICGTDQRTGCRRPTPGNGFLEALCADNTDAITCPIDKITETGVLTTDGKLHEVDVYLDRKSVV